MQTWNLSLKIFAKKFSNVMATDAGYATMNPLFTSLIKLMQLLYVQLLSFIQTKELFPPSSGSPSQIPAIFLLFVQIAMRDMMPPFLIGFSYPIRKPSKNTLIMRRTILSTALSGFTDISFIGP